MPKLKNPARLLIGLHKHKVREPAQEVDISTTTPDIELTIPEKDVAVESSSGGFTDSPPRGTGPALPRAEPMRRNASFSPWMGGEFYLCINVKEGVDLFSAAPVRVATCDSFVRVTLQRPSSLPFQEAETRVLSRNCYPMWEECLPFPLTNMPEDTLINLRVLDKDIGHFNSFLGIVSLPLREALSAIKAVGKEKVYRMRLMDRHGSVRKRGELVFGVSVVAQHEYREMRAVITAIQDPDQVHDCLRDYSLHLKLHGVRELMGLASSALNSLKAEFNVCSTEIRRPLVGELVAGGVDLEDVEVVVPLGPAFKDGDTLKGKTRAQFGEVKIELLSGKSKLAKTQIPIWDVPFRPEGLAMPGSVMEAGVTSGCGGGGSLSDDEDSMADDGASNPDSTEGASAVESAAAESVPPEPALEKRTFLCNLTANIANAVAATALARSYDTPSAPSTATTTTTTLRHTETVLTPGSTVSKQVFFAEAPVSQGYRGADGYNLSRTPTPERRPRVSEGGGGLQPTSIAKQLTGPLSGHSEAPMLCSTANSMANNALRPAPGVLGAAPLSSAPALWDGKRYVRRMERIDRSLARPPVIILSMQLVKAPAADSSVDGGSLGGGGGSVGGGGGAVGAGGSASPRDFDAPDVDSPAEPLSPPPPLPIPIADFVVCAGPQAVARAMFADGSELGERVMAIEKMNDMKISPWGPDSEGKALYERTLNYMKPTVVGPTAVQAKQKMMAKTDGGWHLIQYVMPNIPPSGFVVKVEIQVIGQHVGPNKTRVTSSLTIHWLKSGMMINMVKGKVEDNTPKDTRKYFETLKRELAAKFGVVGMAGGGAETAGAAGTGGDDLGGTAVGVLATAAALTPCGVGGTAGVAGAAAGHGLQGPLSSSAVLAVLGALGLVVVLLLLVLLRVASELRSSQRAVSGLSNEVRGLAEALQALATQLPGMAGTQAATGDIGAGAAAACSSGVGDVAAGAAAAL